MKKTNDLIYSIYRRPDYAEIENKLKRDKLLNKLAKKRRDIWRLPKDELFDSFEKDFTFSFKLKRKFALEIYSLEEQIYTRVSEIIKKFNNEKD